MATEDGALRDAFVQWVAAQTAPPPDPAALIEHIELSHEYVGMLRSEIRGRRIVWKSVPASARTRVTLPAGPSETIDPWTAEADSLRQRSIHIAACTSCGGDKKVHCEACRGAGKTTCSACKGQRKAYGYTSAGAYRLLNCTLCRGKGDVDCIHCRRGVAVCSTCAGEGRLQRWLEIESWQRSSWKVYPQALAEQFSWTEPLESDAIARDAELAGEVVASHQLTPEDIGSLPPQWLTVLQPETTADERIAEQCLRIARVPMRTIHYHLGTGDHRIAFSGLRLLSPAATPDAFAHRAARLRRLRVALVAGAIVVITASLSRGTFFFGIWTFASLAACGVALVAVYATAVDWTAARLHTRMRAGVAAASFVIAIFFAIFALPRATHAEKLIARGDLDAAEAELRALNTQPASPQWADLLLARIRKSTTTDEATTLLAQIPATLPQHAAAVDAVDDLVLMTARDQAMKRRWADASKTLALLSDRGRARGEATAVAQSVCLPSAKERIDHHDWPAAANAIAVARHAGVATHDLEPLSEAIRSAAVDAAAKARETDDVTSRLRRRLAAESTFVAWETSADTWATSPLIALRTAMAQDIATLERAQRHRLK